MAEEFMLDWEDKTVRRSMIGLTPDEVELLNTLHQLLPRIQGESMDSWLRRGYWAKLITRGEQHKLCEGLNFGYQQWCKESK